MILQGNCRRLNNKLGELQECLREHPAHMLTLSEGALPVDCTVPGFIKYICPSMPSFPHGGMALYIARDLPQHCIDSTSLCSTDVECAMA